MREPIINMRFNSKEDRHRKGIKAPSDGLGHGSQHYHDTVPGHRCRIDVGTNQWEYFTKRPEVLLLYCIDLWYGVWPFLAQILNTHYNHYPEEYDTQTFTNTNEF